MINDVDWKRLLLDHVAYVHFTHTKNTIFDDVNESVFRTLSNIVEKHFSYIVNGFEPPTVLAKRSILDIWQGSKYPSGHQN